MAERRNTCFVIMPFGSKEVDGKKVNFDDIYDKLIKPAIEDVSGLKCVRCDDIEKAGWVHKDMMRSIFQARVAVVDLSTLNANVFYELGVRHALCRTVTVLIKRRGTAEPFNLAGMRAILYPDSTEDLREPREKITTFIENGLLDTDQTDSLVYDAIPDLRVQRAPNRLTQVRVTEFELSNKPECSIAFVEGDPEDIMVGDIWVNSENTNMQMDSFYGKSTSATIRYLGAEKDEKNKIVKDTINDALQAKMHPDLEVDPATVLATTAGSLNRNNVKWIFHVASVEGTTREGYQPVSRLDRCVKNALRRVDEAQFQDPPSTSILFPILGTGPGGGDLADHVELCVNAAVEFLESTNTVLKTVYFYTWSDLWLRACLDFAQAHPELKAR